MEQIKNIYTQITNGIFNTTEKLRGYIIVKKNDNEDEEEYEQRQKNSKYMNYFCCFFLFILFIYVAMCLAEEGNNTSSLRRDVLNYDTTESLFDRNSYPKYNRY